MKRSEDRSAQMAIETVMAFRSDCLARSEKVNKKMMLIPISAGTTIAVRAAKSGPWLSPMNM